MNDDLKLFGFLLSKLGLTENEVRWMYQQGASFRKDDLEIRKYLFEDISLPKCFLQELELFLKKEEIFTLLNLNENDIENFFTLFYLDKTPQFPKYYVNSIEEIFYSPEIKWSLFQTNVTNQYNLLSYYDSTNKELRNLIMKTLNEKGLDYSEIGRIFRYTPRYIRDTLSKE